MSNNMKNQNGLSIAGAFILVMTFFAMIEFFLKIGDVFYDPKCAYYNCDMSVSEEGDYCIYHDTYEKRRKKTYGTGSSYNNSTSGSTKSGSSSSGSTKTGSSKPGSTKTGSSSSGSTKTGSSGSKYNSGYYDAYDDGYDDVYMDGDYDQDRYDRDDDYASGVDDAIEDAIDEGEDW